MKAGSEYRVYQGDYTDYQYSATDYSSTPNAFTVEFVTAAGASAKRDSIAQQGFAGASMLVGGGGWVVSANQNPRPALTSKYFAVFSQGAIGTYFPPDPQSGVAMGGAAGPNRPLQSSVRPGPECHQRFRHAWRSHLSGRARLSTQSLEDHLERFGPRLGAAYRLGDKWVVRSGFGISMPE